MPVTAALTIIGTNTRGGQLALAVQILALIATSKHWFKMLLLIVVIGVIGSQILPHKQMKRFENMGEDTTSLQRLLYGKHGWQIIKDHPFLGVGYFNFRQYYDQNYPYVYDLVLPSAQRSGAEPPNNIIIQVGTDIGFPGLAVYLSLMASAWLRMRKLGKEAGVAGDLFVAQLTKGMDLALLGFFVAGQFVTVAYYPYLWIHLVLVAAMCAF